MSEIDEFRNKIRDKATENPEEYLAKRKEYSDANQSSYRLELFFDENSRTVILQGNQAGLENLLRQIERLANPDAVSGAHVHLDSFTELSENDIELIIQRVENDDMGAHTKSK